MASAVNQIEGKVMTTFDNVLQQLRSEHQQAQTAVGKLEQAISAIEGLKGNRAGAKTGKNADVAY